MQTIPASVRTLIKSKLMLGSDQPTAELAFTNTGDSYDWTDLTAWYTPYATADDGVSVAEKANGSLIWCWVASNTVYEGTVSDVDTLLGGDSTVTGAASTGITGVGATRACVFNLDGDLYLHVTSLGDGDNNTWCKVYSSASGNGGDWALHGTVWDVANAWPDTSHYAGGAAGKAVELSTGRWVMPTVEPDQIAHDRRFSIWTSDDGGVTWTRRHYYDNFYMTSHSRQVAVDGNGDLWWAVGTTYGAGSARLYKSTDNGTNWTYPYNVGGSTYAYGMDLLYIDERVYLFIDIDSGSVRVEYFDDLSVDESTTYVTAASGNKDLPLAIEHSDGTLLICADDGVLGVPAVDLTLYPSRLRISRNSAALAQRLTSEWPNVNAADPTDWGYYSPDRGDDVPADKNQWYHVLFPGTELTASCGYGTDTVTAFTGAIDDSELIVDPRKRDLEYIARIDCRDGGWRLLDKTVNDGTGNYYITYTAENIEDIVDDILQKAGWSAGSITTEATGRAMTVTFEAPMTWADALEVCLNASAFELVIDELDNVSFHYPTDREPDITNAKFTLNGTTAVQITNTTDDDAVSIDSRGPVVTDSEVVTNLAGDVTYVKDTDYTMDYGGHDSEATITRMAGGSITDGQQVLVDYVYAAWSFWQGEDIWKLGYKISRRNVYAKIRVIGEDANGNAVTGTYTYTYGIANYGISEDKVLTVINRDFTTAAQCQAQADRMGNDMVRRAREVYFAAPPVPQLQTGLCIQVGESSSTISEIYRIRNMDLIYEPGTAEMLITANYYGHAPL